MKKIIKIVLSILSVCVLCVSVGAAPVKIIGGSVEGSFPPPPTGLCAGGGSFQMILEDTYTDTFPSVFVANGFAIDTVNETGFLGVNNSGGGITGRVDKFALRPFANIV